MYCSGRRDQCLWKKVIDKDDAIQCDAWVHWVHLKCNKLNYTYYKYLQGSSDLCFCFGCCSSIIPFAFLANKAFSSSLYTSGMVPENDSKKKSIRLIPPPNVALLSNQFTNTFLCKTLTQKMLQILGFLLLRKYKHQNYMISLYLFSI